MQVRGYWCEISAVLVLKSIGIALLYCLCVASLSPLDLTPASVAAHLASTSTKAATNPLPQVR